MGHRTEPRSRRNGRGPLAWHDHCLLVPWFGDHGELAGVVIVEDPVDGLLPRAQRRYSLRLLVDLAASIEQTIAQRARLDHLASRDTLTGLRNRRGLHELIGQTGDCTVMVCDLDDFKQINDRYGHDTGDLVLARFAEILREQTRESDIAVRLGGDEFCVVLVGTDDGGALVSERIRASTPIAHATTGADDRDRVGRPGSADQRRPDPSRAAERRRRGALPSQAATAATGPRSPASASLSRCPTVA